ncbi:MAG: transporter [Rhodocyclaceae bacterium]|nr:transporter [Rhodocyclaceae bacterium]
MKGRVLPLLAATAVAGFGHAAIAAESSSGDLTMMVGVDYSTGEYGSEKETRTWVVPFIAKYENGPTTLKASIPWIRTTGPGDVIGVGPDRIPAEGSENETKTESGIGDLVLSAGYAAVQNRHLLLDVIVKVKIPTADEDRALGTGKTDYSLQLDGATLIKGLTLFGTVGKKKYGDPDGRDYRDPYYGSIGVGKRVIPSTFAGASYDWRDNVTRTGDEIRELTLFASHRLGGGNKLQAYLVRGFSDNSPDIGAGVILSHRY